jgi:hypothetical protein
MHCLKEGIMSQISRLRSGIFSAAVAAFGLVVITPGAAQAALTPVFEYSFPASWNGTGTAVTDLSSAGNNGIIKSATLPTLSTTVLPSDATPGTASLQTGSVSGSFQTTATGLLPNASIASAGGFTWSIEFLWDGTDSSSYSHTQKLIDYVGTDSLQLVTTSGGTASLNFALDGASPISTTISANTWYKATAIFDTLGNPVSGTNTIDGMGTLTVTPVGGSSTTVSMPVTKDAAGDGLSSRPIGIGEFGYISSTLFIPLYGNIYSASASLGVVPEPASLSLLGLGATALLARRKRHA